MILVDFAGHMASTESVEEAHAFADRLGVDRKWYQEKDYGIDHPHYNLFILRMIDKAIDMGAESVTPQDLVRRGWWNKGRRR